MIYLRSFRTAAFLVLGAVGLAACDSTAHLTPEAVAADPTITPVNVDQLISSYMAANPGADGVPLMNARSRGWILHADNTMTYDDLMSTRELLTRSAVTESSGNRICQERVATWTGVCLNLYRLGDGSIRVEYEFGNGVRNSYVARNISI